MIKVDPKKLPRDEPEDWNPLPHTKKSDQSKSEGQKQTEKNGLAKTTKDTPTIDVLVAYTPAVAANQGNMTSFVNACLGTTLYSFWNSNMNDTQIDFAIVGTVQVNYTESGYVVTDNDRLITENDGYIDNIFTLRDQYHADVVVLLVDYDNHGLAGVAAAIKANSDYAYFRYNTQFVLINYLRIR